MMSRYRGPRRRLIRKLGDLPGLTKKSNEKRKKFRYRNNQLEPVKTPGQHGKPIKVFTKRLSAYGLRLIEKQKVRFNYHLTERQLIRYVNEAKRSSKGTGDVLLNLLEMRLDNIIYRLGMAPTIIAARQLVTHGHVLVNQKKVNIPSYGCKAKDAISIRKISGSQKLVKNNLKSKDMEYKKQAEKRNAMIQSSRGRGRGNWNQGPRGNQMSRSNQMSRGNQMSSGRRGNQKPKSNLIKWRPPRHLNLNRKNLTATVRGSASAKTVQFKLNELLVVEFYSQN